MRDELRDAVAEAEIRGQMRHITAEMARGDQTLDEKEEFIADLRARLSHVEAERDSLRAALLAEIQKGQQAAGHQPSAEALDLARRVLEGRIDIGAARAALVEQFGK
jgi:septal ring factor EnvC (AmiA/AmiB activator)